MSLYRKEGNAVPTVNGDLPPDGPACEAGRLAPRKDLVPALAAAVSATPPRGGRARYSGFMNQEHLVPLCLLFAVSVGRPDVAGSPYFLLLLEVPERAVIPPAVPVNMTEAARALGVSDTAVGRPACFLERPGGRLTRLLSQFEPDRDGHPEQSSRGILCFRLPAGTGGHVRVRVYLTEQHPALPPPPPTPGYVVEQRKGTIVVRNTEYRVTHDVRRQGGFPTPLEFVSTGKVLRSFNWNDRVFKAGLGGFFLRQSPRVKVDLIATGPVRTLVRVHDLFARGGELPESRPRATYEFTYYAGLPFIRVSGRFSQQREFHWPELKCTEIHVPGTDFTRYATDATGGAVPLKADKQVHTGTWAALIDGGNVLGLIGQSVRVYDGHGGYGTYLHGPWVQWQGTRRRFLEYLYLSARSGALAELRIHARTINRRVTCQVTTPPFLQALSRLQRRVAQLQDRSSQQQYAWAAALVERAGHDGGRLAQALTTAKELTRAAAREKPDPLVVARGAMADQGTLVTVANDEVGVGFLREDNHRLLVVSLFDFATGREYLAWPPAPLFSIAVSRRADSVATVLGSGPWAQVTIDQHDGPRRGRAECVLHWQGPAGKESAGLSVTVAVRLHGPRVAWHISVANPRTQWGVRRVDFPCLRLRALDQGVDYVFVPLGSGTLTPHPLQEWRGYSGGYRSGPGFVGRYPSAWCSMQFAGYYDDQGGVYMALHDPTAATKDLRFQPEGGAIRGEISWPAPNMGLPGTGFEQPGRCVTRVFHGDWFDAAQLYKQWLRSQAPWWPRGAQSTRADTPGWMHSVCLWAHEMGDADKVVDHCLKLQAYVGVPLAVHWYSWHRIPFDTNYPHYFPARKGFAEGVRVLQAHGIRVMPYLNGRLWDKDTPDFKSLARPAAAKDERGRCYVEHYGSGRDLIPMCPTTRRWQQTVRELVLRLVGREYRVDGVYLDQISAAGPCLCFDRSHGHPVGGGHWWTTAGYQPLLESIQDRLPSGTMITSECTAEPYCRWLDGYLSWHFQCPGQIPLFASVYGGRVQIFGRAYKGNDRAAFRMKTAQSLVFGEQLGWMSAAQVLQDLQVNGPFIRRLARLRRALLPYLADGEMARPPRVEGDIPTVTADWAWHHYWPVTGSALQRGAWKSADGRLALIFVNVAGQPLSARVHLDGASYGFAGTTAFHVTPRTESGRQTTFEKPRAFTLRLRLPPYDAVAYELEAR